MNNNITYEVEKKEVQKKIINYLFQDKEITIVEYESLMSNCEDRINKLNNQLDKDKYNYEMKVDIRI